MPYRFHLCRAREFNINQFTLMSSDLIIPRDFSSRLLRLASERLTAFCPVSDRLLVSYFNPPRVPLTRGFRFPIYATNRSARYGAIRLFCRVVVADTNLVAPQHPALPQSV